MNQDVPLKVQAYLDGELSPGDVRQMEDLLARDREASGLLEELRNTTAALRETQSPVTLPESREFFWSKIKREINRLERVTAEKPHAAPSIFVLLRKYLVPLGGAAAALVVGMLLLKQPDQPGTPTGAGSQPLVAQGEVHAVDSILDNTEVLTFRDQTEGMTVVWVSYKAHN